MCSNFRAVTDVERMAKFFSIAPDDVPPVPDVPEDAWPTTPAPFIRLSAEGILHIDQYDGWLTCKVEDASTLFRQYLGELHAYAAPLPTRTPKPKRPKGQPDPKDAPLL